MEEFKSLDQILQIDERHLLLGQVTGRLHSLESLHASLAAIDLHPDVPEDVRGQFNVARNMALYTLFHYAMAPEVQMKTFSVIELGLKRRLPEAEGRGLAGLLKAAIARNLLSDAGFRHIENPSPENAYCKTLVTVLPALRNEAAHGSTNLSPYVRTYIEVCADFLNQLFASAPVKPLHHAQ
jgi:hypothetical protein